MTPMQPQEDKLERLETALRAVYRQDAAPETVNVAAVMARVAWASAKRRREARFLSRFLMAAGVAASVLLVASVWNGSSPDTIALRGVTDSPWGLLIGPTLLNPEAPEGAANL